MAGPVRDTADWSIIFDTVASEYGYTWEQFTALTYKMLQALLDAIARRRHEDLRSQAALQGIKIQPYEKIKPPTEAALQAAEAKALEILKKKREKINAQRQ